MTLSVPKVTAVAQLERDLFQFDKRETKITKLPENFYLRTAADLPPQLSFEDTLEFLLTWGPPFSLSAVAYNTGVDWRRIAAGIAKLGQIARFAIDWFESEKSIVPEPRFAKEIETALASLQPRIRVSGAGENWHSNVTALAVAEWAEDIRAGRVLRECDFCGERFTKQRGRSVSGRYRTTTQTRFCSHSCANRKGNQRRTIQRKEEFHG